MFQGSLCPSSGALDRMSLHCIWFSALDVLAGVLGSREADRVHCAQCLVKPGSRPCAQCTVSCEAGKQAVCTVHSVL